MVEGSRCICANCRTGCMILIGIAGNFIHSPLLLDATRKPAILQSRQPTGNHYGPMTEHLCSHPATPASAISHSTMATRSAPPSARDRPQGSTLSGITSDRASGRPVQVRTSGEDPLSSACTRDVRASEHVGR
ncbi:hypothetical protein BD626DRAFT_29799 [Schizophyllum amplum]|uniref:Uncharacterized protein n=1 Tax=Schizophyllum amplum TaxID=97359 RepID=A0A550D0E8_9AGAR|nr:hypothetical protein BD626DRAFT_29799 [Auriculariopsis ampla]